jgi:hypothetical protein
MNYDHSTVNQEDRLFDLVEGALLHIDHHGHSELISVDELIRKYIKGESYMP